LVHARQTSFIDPRHALARLTDLGAWRVFEDSLGPPYKERCRPAAFAAIRAGQRPLKIGPE
jgi:hypothetical protein